MTQHLLQKVTFLESGSGDPAARFENARLQLELHRAFKEEMTSFDLSQMSSRHMLSFGRDLVIDPASITPGTMILGDRQFMGGKVVCDNFVQELNPSIWGHPDIYYALPDRSIHRVPLSQADRIVNQITKSSPVHIFNEHNPMHWYRRLGKRLPNWLELDRNTIADCARAPHDSEDVITILSEPNDLNFERRFIFVDGALVTDTPIAFNLELWRDAINGDPDGWHADGFRIFGGQDAGITREQRAWAEDIAILVGFHSGAIDIGWANGRPELVAAHQAHAGDYNLHGADIAELAIATATYVRGLGHEPTCELSPA